MINRNNIFIIIFGFGLIQWSCENYEFPESPYPQVETLSVINIDDTGVTFQADITYLGKDPVINHGFVWGFEKNNYIRSSEKVELGEISRTGLITVPVKFGLDADTTYYVAAFVANADYFVYGKTLTFKSKGGTTPILESISPNSGGPGDLVTISGNYFSNKINSNKILFGDVLAVIQSASDSEIIVKVPNLSPGSYNVTAGANGKTAISTESFLVN